MAAGGARMGAGRKTKAEEKSVMMMARKAIIKRYGSMDKGFAALLVSGEPSLIRFAYEHAFGKPQEKVDLTSGGQALPVKITLNLG